MQNYNLLFSFSLQKNGSFFFHCNNLFERTKTELFLIESVFLSFYTHLVRKINFMLFFLFF